MDKLGKRAKDKITEFEGIITAKVVYLFGCNQYGITPSAINGKIGDTHYFDQGRIDIIGDGIEMSDVIADKPGGVNRDSPR